MSSPFYRKHIMMMTKFVQARTVALFALEMAGICTQCDELITKPMFHEVSRFILFAC